MTRDIFKTILLLCALLCFIFAISSCGEEPRSTHPAQQDIDTLAYSMPQALRVVPGTSWARWNSGDSILLNGFALMSQDAGNSKERIVTDSAVLAWLVGVLPDSLALSGYADTLRLSNDTLYISGQNYVLLSDYLDNTDAQTLTFQNDTLSISGGNDVSLAELQSSAESVMFSDTLTFNKSRYYSTYTATDTIHFVVDTTSQKFGTFTIARINFGSGEVVSLPADYFDTLQLYNISDGQELTGIHTLYFENTPFGVAVSAPTNETVSGDYTVVTLAEDFTTGNNSNTNVTGFAFTPDTGSTYVIEGYLLLRTTNTGTGARPAITFPSNLVDGASRLEAPSSNTTISLRYQGDLTTTNSVSSAGLPTTTDSYLSILHSVIITGGGTTGSFQITLSTETPATDVTMKAGSILMYKKI